MTEARTLLIAGDEPAFLKKAAQLIFETAAEAVKERQRATLALAGGATPKKVYALLADPYYESRMPWRDISFFWGDERCVAPDHPDSNYKMANDAMLSKVPAVKSNIHRMAGEMSSPQEAAKAYEQDLKLAFKNDRPFPKFDLMLLGIGEDGHTASLFPESPALQENQKWVAGYRVEKLAANRITLTFPVLNNARRVLFLCAGEKKAGVIKEIFREDASPRRYPAAGVRPRDGETIWLLDAGAASKLPFEIKSKAQTV